MLKSTRVWTFAEGTRPPQHADKSAAVEVAWGLEPPRPGLSILVSSLILSETNLSLLAGVIISIVFWGLWQT